MSGKSAFVIKISMTSELSPPLIHSYDLIVLADPMVKLTIRVIIAVLRNYAIPSFLATLISNSVWVLCLSIWANLRITKPRTMLIMEIRTEATKPKIVMAMAVALEVLRPEFCWFRKA